MGVCAVPARGVDWGALRRSVVDLEVSRPGVEGTERAYGFALTGVPGIIACHRAVAGAELVQVRTADGASFAITEYLADDPERDLTVLRSGQPLPGLERGTHELLAPAQTAFVILPPSVAQMQTYRVGMVNTFEARGPGELVVFWGDISTGLPAADSLGRVVGIIEAIREGSLFAVTAIPIARISDLLSRPDPGGLLASLDPARPAPWTQPGEPEGAQVLGAALCRTQRYSTGLPLLTRAVQQKPDLVEAMLEIGQAYQSQKEYAEAQRHYEQALDLRPNYARGQLFLGSCFFSQGKYDKAKERFQLALDADPDYALAHLNVGGVLYQQSDQPGAEAAFKRALALVPEMGLAHYNLGMLYRAAGRTEELRQTMDFLRSRGSGYAPMLVRGGAQPQK